jgi:DNA polymerase-4
MQRIILLLDMNSYFASVEQQDNPEWRGKVLGVCEHLGGIIIAASREAKQWGIKTGTPVWEAKKLYPKIILTHTRAEAYRQYNKKMVKLVSDYTDKVEVFSIDEVFLDITRVCNVRLKSEDLGLRGSLNLKSEILNPYMEAVRVAREIKARMKREVGEWLTCSIGIAENKLLAKIGSDLKKPDGMVVIQNKPSLQDLEREGERSNQVFSNPSLNSSPGFGEGEAIWFGKEELYERLKLTDIPGIGHRTEKRLNALGIRSLKDLRDYPESRLVALFGLPGYHLYNMGQLKGSWKARVEQDQEIKSMGHMYTLPKEFRSAEFFLPTLYKLSEMVGKRLRRKKLEGCVLHFYCYGEKYASVGKSLNLHCYIDSGRELFFYAVRLAESLGMIGKGYRLIAITLAGLRPHEGQLELFRDKRLHGRLEAALDKINAKYGDFTICRVPILKAGKAFRDSVGFGRVKEI